MQSPVLCSFLCVYVRGACNHEPALKVITVKVTRQGFLLVFSNPFMTCTVPGSILVITVKVTRQGFLLVLSNPFKTCTVPGSWVHTRHHSKGYSSRLPFSLIKSIHDMLLTIPAHLGGAGAGWSFPRSVRSFVHTSVGLAIMNPP